MTRAEALATELEATLDQIAEHPTAADIVGTLWFVATVQAEMLAMEADLYPEWVEMTAGQPPTEAVPALVAFYRHHQKVVAA